MEIIKEIFFRYVPFFFVYSIIFYLSSRTVSELPSSIPDVIPHFIEYFVLSFFFMRIVRTANKKNILFLLIFLLLLAFLDEVHQLFVPTRFFSIKDVFMDLLGITFGIILYNSKAMNYIKILK